MAFFYQAEKNLLLGTERVGEGGDKSLIFYCFISRLTKDNTGLEAMVGAAQYRDEEIDWVLTAVVNKKKQSYIQERFKHKFGRELNHNQIRYIKNKYGKDPKFK